MVPLERVGKRVPKKTSDYTTPVRSADRMLSVLSWFSLENPTGCVAEIANDLDLAPSTVRRLVAALEQHRFLAWDAVEGKYRLHVEIMRLAAVISTTNDIVQSATPIMDSFCSEFGETVTLGVLDGPVVVQLRVELSTEAFSIYPPKGRRYKAFEGGAAGMILLAWTKRADLDAILPESDSWPAYAPEVTIHRGRFLRALQKTRSAGYAINDGVTDPDMWSTAAPIVDHFGRVVAAISSPCRRRLMTPDRKKKILSALVEGGQKISASLGFDESSS